MMRQYAPETQGAQVVSTISVDTLANSSARGATTIEARR